MATTQQSTPPRPRSRKRTFVNILGTLGYFSILMQWLWVGLVYIPLLAESPLRGFFFPPERTTPEPVTPVPAEDPNILLIIIGGIVSALIIGLTIVILVKLPRQIGKTGQKLTTSAAHVVMPVITHHKPIKKNKRILLTYRVVMALKAIGVIVPLIGILPASTIENLGIDFLIILILAVFCAAWSIAYFSAQYLAAWALKVPKNEIW